MLYTVIRGKTEKNITWKMKLTQVIFDQKELIFENNDECKNIFL